MAKPRSAFFEKVDRTWRKLKRQKIVGVRGLCCGSCSACEAGNRMERDNSLVGYAYYHQQDREDAARRGLYVGYGVQDGGEEQIERVAKTLKALFEADGFRVEWDGSTSHRLLVKS